MIQARSDLTYFELSWRMSGSAQLGLVVSCFLRGARRALSYPCKRDDCSRLASTALVGSSWWCLDGICDTPPCLDVFVSHRCTSSLLASSRALFSFPPRSLTYSLTRWSALWAYSDLQGCPGIWSWIWPADHRFPSLRSLSILFYGLLLDYAWLNCYHRSHWPFFVFHLLS